MLRTATDRNHLATALRNPANVYRVLLVLVGVFVSALFIFYNQVHNSGGVIDHSPSGLQLYLSDVPQHLGFINALSEGESVIPHPGLHWLVLVTSRLLGVGFGPAMVVWLAVFVTATAGAMFVLLNLDLGGKHTFGTILAFTVSLMLVGAIYAPWINPRMYLGQGSPNVWHNPTLIAVKPFAFICVGAYLWAPRVRRNRRAILLAVAMVALAVSALIKPNFALVFIPAVPIYLLLSGQRRASDLVVSAAVVAPAIAILLVQYWASSHVSGMQGLVMSAIDPLGVWRLYTPNIPASLCLALAFPLALLVLRFDTVRREPELILAWLMLAAGVMQFALLSVTGPHRRAGDWSWGYLVALQILFLYCVRDLLQWSTTASVGRRSERAKLAGVSLIYALHLAAGIVYFLTIASGGSYY
jgi:hypothetical protein